MEKKAIRIVSQEPLTQRNWTNQRGETIVIKTKEFLLDDGVDRFVAEASDSTAEVLENQPIPDGTVVNCQLRMTVREWESQQTHEKQRATSIKIIKLAAV